jgi:hypothetical protein
VGCVPYIGKRAARLPVSEFPRDFVSAAAVEIRHDYALYFARPAQVVHNGAAHHPRTQYEYLHIAPAIIILP